MFKWVSEIKDVGYNKELNELTNKLPDNNQICLRILEKLNNKNVKVKEDDGKQASLYLVVSNTIIIANIKNSFTRVQTIAHECIHSTQSKKILWFNFIFSNLFLIYFFIITILAFLDKTNNWMYAFTILLSGFIFYCVRSYLELDAMIRARFVAQDYLNENLGVLTKEEIELILSKYDYINNTGIKLAIGIIMWKSVSKLIIFGIICFI